MTAPYPHHWSPPAYHPRRRQSGPSANAVDAYLEALDRSLAGQNDPALEAEGIVTPLGTLARAAIVEAIGADLEAAVRDLMLSGIPRGDAELQAISTIGPPARLGRDLLATRRQRAAEAWERRRESLWWWTEPLVPAGMTAVAIFLAATAPTIAVIAGMVVEPQLGTLAVAVVPLVLGLFIWVAGALAPFASESQRR